MGMGAGWGRVTGSLSTHADLRLYFKRVEGLGVPCVTG